MHEKSGQRQNQSRKITDTKFLQLVLPSRNSQEVMLILFE